ncbi:MAG TPA: hypothetical protein PKE26_08845 [Kiritimatiellia bacterium]|nr:hypothetical protein [Kiritimatiellia bacterium]HMO99203.1 hypothetical protein [Kiritimatiellia bacterium]HMP95790.1 hypothetical protein [Kiritimatiellia bacterium]
MNHPAVNAGKKSWGCLHVLLALIVLLLAAILGSMWWVKRNAYASSFTPVILSEAGQATLDAKLNAVDPSTAVFGGGMAGGIYEESDERRRLVFSEDELNAVLAKDPDLAQKVRFRLSERLVSVQVLAPVDPEIPVLGGKTLKFSIGLELAYTNEAPVIAVRGISIGGIPLPAAWWGDIKNKNLVDPFVGAGGFWDLFSRGVEYLDVQDGRFVLHLKP